MSHDGDGRPPWMNRFVNFWEVFALISFASGIIGTHNKHPELLTGWSAIRLGALLVTFLGFYLIFKRYEQRCSVWPRPYWPVLLYVAIQLIVALMLLEYSPAFIGTVFMLAGQIAGALPIRLWPVPMGMVVAVLGWNMGIGEGLRNGERGEIIGAAFFVAWLLAVMGILSLLFQDRAQREGLIADLRHAHDELERTAAQAEELAALRERTRLAREMHDSIGHALVLVNVKLEVAQRLYAVDANRGDCELEATRELVRTTMADLRRSLADLRAPLPDHNDLPAALQRVAGESSERSGLAIRCDTDDGLPALAPATSETLWRVAREAISNVERHAAAASVEISLHQTPDGLVLRVADDGSGITPAALQRSGHYGITGMRERVEALGGALAIVARPGGGTLVEAHVPLDTAAVTA